MAIINLILKAISVIVRSILLIFGNKEQTSNPVSSFQEAPPNVLDAFSDFKRQSLPDIFEALDGDGQESLLAAALQYEDESLALDLIPKMKNPDFAYRSLITACQNFVSQDKSTALARALKLAYPLLPQLSFTTPPSAGFRELNLLATENLKPNKAWGILNKGEKIIAALKQLDQDISRELLAESKLSVLRSSPNPQHSQKLLQEMEASVEAIDSHNIKARAKFSLFEAQLAIFEQFGEEQAWQKAKKLGISLHQIHDPRPISRLVQTAYTQDLPSETQAYYLDILEKTRIDLGPRPFVWVNANSLKVLAKTYQDVQQIELFFTWLSKLPAAYEHLEEEEDSSYFENPFHKISPYLQLAEVCLQYKRVKLARVFLKGILDIIPTMNEKYLRRVEQIDIYLHHLSQLYRLEQKGDLFEALEGFLASYYDPIQLQLLVHLCKTYYQLSLTEKGDKLLQNMPAYAGKAPSSKLKLGGRVFKPLFAQISPQHNAPILIDTLLALLALELDPFRQAMAIEEFLRGADEEQFVFEPAIAERLVAGLDRQGDTFSQIIGRASIVNHISLSPDKSQLLLNQAWSILKEATFDKDFREQTFWILPIVAKYEPSLTKQMFDYIQGQLSSLTDVSLKDDWRDTLFWGLSHGPLTDWEQTYIQSFGEAATEEVQSQMASSVERWAQQNPNIQDLVSLLELSVLITEPIHRARAISAIVPAAAAIGEWEQAFSWVKHIRLYYYTALAYIKMMIVRQNQLGSK